MRSFDTAAAALSVCLSISGLLGCGSNDGADAKAALAATTSGGMNSAAGNVATGGSSKPGGTVANGGKGGGDAAGSGSVGGNSSNGGAAGGNAGGAAGGNATCGTATCGAGPTGMAPFPASSPFYQDISTAALDGESTKLITALAAIGWGDEGHRTELGIDFSFNINLADAGLARRAFTKSGSFYAPDCDTAPVPLPPGGKGEGVDNYSCSSGEDCHLFVYQSTRLYELYQSNITGGMATGGTFAATCLVVWDLTKDYWVAKAPPSFSRGDGCTGADAAGLPMTPLVLTKQDIMSGTVKHALRFTIDNNRIAKTVYVHPATHLGGPTGGIDMLPYGARLRLRANFDLATLPNANARTVAKALQTYGMYLADGGNIYISATADASDLINNSILSALKPSDFEMVDGGARVDAASQDCKHVPVTD
jgi:hypothetical protein